MNSETPTEANSPDEIKASETRQLDFSMLINQADKQRKKQRQEELIKKANEQKNDEIKGQKDQEQKRETIEKISKEEIRSRSQEYFEIVNDEFEDYGIEPLNEKEKTQIISVIHEFTGNKFSRWIHNFVNEYEGKSSTIKSIRKYYKLLKVIKKIVYPRLKALIEREGWLKRDRE